jgi:methionyl-tRNA formyltransferase
LRTPNQVKTVKIVFFGTPDFAVPSLEKLHGSSHSVQSVVTAPDKPRGRGRSVLPTPVARRAGQMGLPVLKPINLKDESFLNSLAALDADLFAVVAFRVLPEEVFSMPSNGSVNLHASLLPKYRGAAPIQWAICNGETETGLTTFQIRKAVDTGNILKQRRVEILSEDDAGSLGSKMAEIGAELLLETLNELEAGTLTPKAQDPAQASRAPKITKEHCEIRWHRSAGEIHNQVRALSPQPGAVTFLDEQMLKIYRTAVRESSSGLRPGEAHIDDQGITIGTGSGELVVLELQLQGKKRMDTTTFLRGFRPRGVFQLKGGEK